MNEYTFEHEGRPKPKERPRTGRGGRVYTPRTTLDAEALLAASYHGPMFNGPIEVLMTFGPKLTVITIRDWFGDPSPLRSDWDNLGKLPSDALQGIAYPNDRQIMACNVQKVA